MGDGADGMAERFGHCIFFELKEEGKPVPRGQEITHESWLRIGYSVILLWHSPLHITYPIHNATQLHEQLTIQLDTVSKINFRLFGKTIPSVVEFPQKNALQFILRLCKFWSDRVHQLGTFK